MALVVAGLYLVSSRSAFQFDDLHSIVGNPHLRSLANLPWFFVRSDMFSEHSWGRMYRPLVLAFHAANYAWGGDQVAGYRVVNALLHALNSGLVVALLAALGQSRGPAVLGGLVFGLLPVNSEVVYYISARSESLSALFLFVAVLAYVRGTARGMVDGRWLALGTAAYGLALLSKETGIILPAWLVLWEASRLPAGSGRAALPRHLLRRQWGVWVVSLAYLAGARGHVIEAAISHPVRLPAVQLATQAKAWLYYVLLLWQPTSLSVEHQFRLVDSVAGAVPAAGAVLVLASGAWLVLRLGRRFGGLHWAGWAALALLPTSLVPLNVLVNEHRLYLPSVAFSFLVAACLGRLSAAHRAWGSAAVALLLVIYGALAARRGAAWADAGRLWGEAVVRAPLMPRPHLFLGDHYQAVGDYGRALREYALAETVYPAVLSPGDRLQLHNNRGAALLTLGRFTQAEEEYRRALRIDPTYPPSRDALEGLQAMAGARRDPRAEALQQQGLALVVQGRLDEAAARFQASLQAQSWPDAWLSLGLVYERLGKVDEARAAYRSLALVGQGTPFESTARDRMQALEGQR
ncbi:MAG: tetratricopeptide repeat protein [Gemmatimonadota bacterium]